MILVIELNGSKLYVSARHGLCPCLRSTASPSLTRDFVVRGFTSILTVSSLFIKMIGVSGQFGKIERQSILVGHVPGHIIRRFLHLLNGRKRLLVGFKIPDLKAVLITLGQSNLNVFPPMSQNGGIGIDGLTNYISDHGKTPPEIAQSLRQNAMP